jgi:hypothetical protein
MAETRIPERDPSPQSVAYKHVCGRFNAKTKYARDVGRTIVKLLRARNRRDMPSEKTINSFCDIYDVSHEHRKHVSEVVRETLNKDLEAL